MALITGSWKDTTLVCGNHKETGDFPKMELDTSSRLLAYVCPKCSALNRKDDEPVCKNRLTVYDYEKMLDHIASLVADADANDEVLNLNNYRWKRKTTEFKVLKHDGNSMTISVIDKTLV